MKKFLKIVIFLIAISIQLAGNLVISQTTISYSESFTQGVAYQSYDSQWINWSSFISQLSPRTYTSVTISGSNDDVGVSVTDAITATAIASALFSNVSGSWTSGGLVWNVGSCGSGIELSAGTTGTCRCETAYTVRPQIGNSSWGGINSVACGSGTQSMTVVFASGDDVTQTFNYTGSVQSLIIPTGVTSVSIEAWGAKGANTSYSGGAGGYAKGDLAVTPGEVLYLYVGGQGGIYSVGDQGSWTAGGWNGGGLGYRNGRGGGGASDVRQGGAALANRVIIASGGGGASNTSQCYGGYGGGITGNYGLRFNASDPGFCGQGGTQSVGGAACINYGSAAAGSLGQGGNGGTSGNYDGTGGGGGYYGGGGGDQGGAGGGSSYIGGLTNASTIEGLRSGDGQINITYESFTNDQTFTYSGSSQTWDVPAGVTSIEVEAWGAQGGPDYLGNAGGAGARMHGVFSVTPGETLGIVVGGLGTNYGGSTSGGGGGGGSFVWHENNYTEPMIAVGGGGGGWSTGDGSGLTTTSGGTPVGGGDGGSSGNGGNTSGDCSGSGGAGWKSDGVSSGCNSNGDTGGQSKFGFTGGSGYGLYGGNGGFGGGGGTTYGGAGGGGYSGGGGGANSTSRGGGGGSYNAGIDQSNSAGVRLGNGLVVILYTLVTITTPNSPTIAYGISSVNLTATVAPNPGGGSVEFFVIGSSVGSANVDAGTGIATLSYATSSLGIGSYGIRADFSGYNSFPASSSNPSSNGILTVNKANQVITFNTLAAKTYGDLQFVVSATGGSSGNPVTFSSSNIAVATYTGLNGTTITITGAGSCTIYANQAGNSNYNAAEQVGQILTVNKATISVTADNKSRVVGQSNPAFTITLSGFVNSENSSVLNVLPSASCSANLGSPVGTYSIIPSGGLDNNYSYSYINGTLTITNPGFDWGGTISTNWSTPGNWSTNLVPAASNNVNILSGTPNLPHITSFPTSPSVCNALSIASGAILIIDAGKALTINGILSNTAGPGGLIIESGGSLLNNTSGVNATVKRQLTASEWHLISAPISNAVSGMFDGKYLQEHTEYTNGYTDITSLIESLTPMEGFAIWGDASGFTATFTGTMNSGVQSYSTSYSGMNKGWNLVGNPYSSSIDWNASGWTKTNVNATTYIHKDPSTWATYNGSIGTNGGSQYIAPCQGFFIEANAVGILSSSNNVKVHNSTTFFKNSEVSVDNLVRLEIVGNGYSDEAVVWFNPEATNEFDGEYDAHKLFGEVSEAAQLYTLGSSPLAINTLPETSSVSVGIHAGTIGKFTLSATEIKGFTNLYLEDTKTSVITDLLNNTYSFIFIPEENEQRFVLHFGTLSVNEMEYSVANIYSYDKTVWIDLENNVRGDVYIYNISGQLVASYSSVQGSKRVNMANTGNYLVKIITDKSTLVKKVLVQ